MFGTTTIKLNSAHAKMPFQQIPQMDYKQLKEDQNRALDATPKASTSTDEQLPAYEEAMKRRQSVQVAEKEAAQGQKSKSSGSKMSTLKSILTGNVHKQNPSK